MAGGTIAPFFDAASWAAEWEAEGGALRVRYHPGTRCVLAVRWIMPVPRACWVRGLPSVYVGIPGPRMPTERFDKFSDLSSRIARNEPYRSLVRLMQARVDAGAPVQECSGCVNDI